MEYTPGPWSINGPYHIQAPTISLEKNLPRVVASVVTGHYVTATEKEGNAQLISAAPEMFELLAELAHLPFTLSQPTRTLELSRELHNRLTNLVAKVQEQHHVSRQHN